jgi:hypothetical protein
MSHLYEVDPMRRRDFLLSTLVIPFLTARAIDVTVPASLLAHAHEMIK